MRVLIMIWNVSLPIKPTAIEGQEWVKSEEKGKSHFLAQGLPKSNFPDYYFDQISFPFPLCLFWILLNALAY